MTGLEDGLRSLVAALVHDEVARQLAAARTPDEFLSMREAADVAKVDPATVRRWIREGQLERLGAGRHLRVRRADLERRLRDGGRRDDETPEQRYRRHHG